MIKTFPLQLVLFLLITGLSCQSQMILSDGQHTRYRVIVPEAAAPEEIKAAETLQHYFLQVSGVSLALKTDTLGPSAYEIVIGKSRRLHQEKLSKHFEELGPDGFVILTKKNKLYIAGETPAGTLNGVYTFLEKYLHCRFYSPDVRIIPRSGKVVVPGINDRQVPVFSYREMYFPGRNDPDYREWHKLHSHHAGEWGMWVHTFKDLVPAERYFKSNPEYFTEINGARVPDGQLCLTNPEVFEVLVSNLEKKMQMKPRARYWSVSQNDNFLSCRCSSCREAAVSLGGESGIMIDFVNRVAEKFPDKTISTLAYQYTRAAPSKVKPLPNVNIMLCSIECNRSQPLKTDPGSASFVRDVEDWTRLTDNILIWDYVVQFRNYISPFPNLQVLQPNLEFFADNNCRLMFQQGSGSSLSEFVELRSYLVAKLLWDPQQDFNELMNDFLNGYYGPAAPFIRSYIDLLHEELAISGDNLWIYGFPFSGIDSYLRPELIPGYEKLFDQAEAAVAGDPELLDRVHAARLPLEFAILDISLHRVDEQLSWFSETGGKWAVKEEMLNRLDTFVARCNRLGLSALNERGFTPDEYRQQIKNYLQKNSERHLGLNKPVTLLTEYSAKYEAGGPLALTDGLRGIDDYHFNWLGFEGNDLEAVIDLGEEKLITAVSADFLQNNYSWIFLPKSFTVEVSEDGIRYHLLGHDENMTPDQQSGSFIQTFSVPAGNVTARFIKARAESLKTCPPWHIGSGEKCWIFTDEIVIR